MKLGLFIVGATILLFSFVIWSYDQPRADLFTSGVGQLALLNDEVREQYQSLQEEIFWSKIGMLIGVIIIIPSIVLGRKKSLVSYCKYCNKAFSIEADLINHLNDSHKEEIEKETIRAEQIATIENKRRTIKNRGIAIGVITGIGGGAAFALFIVLVAGSGFVARGSGMEPFFYDGDYLVMTKVSFEQIMEGDVIVYRNPDNPAKVTAHRVVSIIDDNPKTVRAQGDNNPASIPGTDYPITNQEYIGKIDNVIPKMGALFGTPGILIIIAGIIFVTPIIIMYLQVKKKLHELP